MASDQAEESSSLLKGAANSEKDEARGGSNLAAALPRAPDSQNSTAPTESNAVTVESRVGGVRANHVSATHSAATSTCSAPRGDLSAAPDCQVERPSPQIQQSESAQLKKGASSLKAPPQKKDTVRNETKKNMCMAEPQEQRSDEKKKKSGGKMYEIPLTILPGEEAAAPKRKKTKQEGVSSGRWTHEEHQAFLEGLKVFGREWKKVATQIPTRSSAQIRSHAQKYFSKLAREETLLQHQPSAAVASAPAQSQEDLSMSVQRTAERILANPTGAQAEVEDTLRQLRERYRQLQIRLEQSQRARGLPPMDRIAEDPVDGGGGGIPAGLIHRGGHAPGLDRRKRTLEEANLHQHQDDGASSVSSDLSHSLASLSPKREFGNEELIALHVLGGSLPRSASGTDLQVHSRSSSFSEAEDSEAKRQRLGTESTNDHPAEEGGDDSNHDEDGDEAMI